MSEKPPILPYRTPEPGKPRPGETNTGAQFGVAFLGSLIVGSGLSLLMRSGIGQAAAGIFLFVIVFWFIIAIALCSVSSLRGYGLGLLVGLPVTTLTCLVFTCAR